TSRQTNRNTSIFLWIRSPRPKACFQQWFPSHFEDKDVEVSPSFRTSEHYMIYRKAFLFGDEGVANKIMAAQTPGEAKTLGRQAGPFNQAKWDSSCDDIIERGNYIQFGQNPKLKEILLNTGDKVIVEASPSDRIWGISFDTERAERNEADWGTNKLGDASMRVRGKLSS
ncbi:uncharacterized protein PAC_13854, partial [Phialocephala subalpina]